MTALFKHHFQVCYLVDDARQGMTFFGETCGISQWHVIDMVAMMGPQSPLRTIALAWAGDTMIELAEPIEAVPSIYSNWRRDSGLAARFHHLGFLAQSEQDYAEIKGQLAAAGFPVVVENTVDDVLMAAQIDTTGALGHYYELIHLVGGMENPFFAPVPRN